jgi:methylenetetrahydrofolate reductase (NADH)
MSAVFSFEVFPPRTPEGELRLWDTLERLAPLEPRFVSVTCGAGGSATDATLGVMRAVAERTSLPIAGHLTCVGRSRKETDAHIVHYWNAGVRHIVALRGDAPGDTGRFEPHPDGYPNPVELIAAIRRQGPFEISVAAYPEPHADSVSMVHDLALLARKADAGASRAITQFCFDTDLIVSLRERIVGAGIALRVVPGILLATDYAAVARMATRCGASLPSWLGERFTGLDDDPQTRKLVGAIVAAEQVDRLRREGFEDFHFYTLNQGDLAPAVCRLLGVRQAPEQADAA